MSTRQIRTGISTLVDLDIPFPDLLRRIAEAGFSHVSLSHSVEHANYHRAEGRDRIARLLESCGLELNYIHTPLQRWFDLTSLDDQVRRVAIEAAKMAVKACAELQGDSVVVHATNEPDVHEAEFAARVAAGLASLEELASFAAELSVKISLENLPGDKDWHRLTTAIMQAAHFPDLVFCLDTCHAWIALEEPLSFVRSIAGRVRTLHLSDTHGLLDSHLIPGEGRVDFEGTARELALGGFNGVVDLECSLWMLRHRLIGGRPAPGDPEAVDTDEYLARSYHAALRIGEAIEAARES
jgi:sugar phosphate isomerase/epimerase